MSLCFLMTKKKTQLHKITNVKLHWWLTIESDVTCRIQTKKGWRKSIFIRWNGVLAPFFEAQHGDLEGGHWHRTLHQLKEKKKSSIHCGTGVCKRGHEQKQQSKQTEEGNKSSLFDIGFHFTKTCVTGWQAAPLPLWRAVSGNNTRVMHVTAKRFFLT